MAGQPDIGGTNTTVVSATRVTCDFDLTDAAPGAWDVVLTNPDGQSATLSDGFTVIDASAKKMQVATDWKDLGAFEDFLVERLTGKQ